MIERMAKGKKKIAENLSKDHINRKDFARILALSHQKSSSYETLINKEALTELAFYNQKDEELTEILAFSSQKDEGCERSINIQYLKMLSFYNKKWEMYINRAHLKVLPFYNQKDSSFSKNASFANAISFASKQDRNCEMYVNEENLAEIFCSL